MCRNRPLYLISCVVSLAGPLGLAGQERDRLRASVRGVTLPEGVRHEIVVEEQVDQPPTARITVSGRKGQELADAVKLGDDVKVESGRPDSAADSILTGEVIGIEIFHTPDGHHMVIRAFNRLHRLTRARRTREFVDVTDAEIVATIARENGLAADEASSPPTQRYDHVFQHNQTDLDFLLVRAARIGFDVWCEDTTLFFRKAEDHPPIVLASPPAAGDLRLTRFHPRLSSSDTVQKVVVRGWDPDRREIVGEAAAPTVLLTDGDPDPGLVFGRTVELLLEEPISSVEEAKAIAKSKLGEVSLSYITGEAEASGSPRLRPGSLAVLAGVGERFDSQYYVAGVSHRFSHGEGCDGGYRSRLRVRRQPIALFFIPEIDDEVLVAFEHGDLSRPFVVGSLWDDDDCTGDRPPRP
jgi:phage protein D